MKVLNKVFISIITMVMLTISTGILEASAASGSTRMNIPGNAGTITSNVWRHTQPLQTGNNLNWGYQVSAVYTGTRAVERIRTTWVVSSTMRKSARITVGVSNDGWRASSSSNWQTVRSAPRFWQNSNGAKTSSWRSNIIITPRQDYRSGSLAVTNTALVKLRTDARTFEISAAA